MNIAIFGQGLNSLVSASLFASVGNQVYLKTTKDFSQTDITEPGLQRLYNEQLASGRLKSFSQQQNDIEIVLFAENNSAALLQENIQQLAAINHKTMTFIVMTPSYLGEVAAMENHLQESAINGKVACIPLLIREGQAINDFSRPARIILGCNDEPVLNKLKSLLYPFNRVKDTIKVVRPHEAEFSSFAGNAMLATRLSFMNEMANLAERLHVDIDVVRECIGSDPRIGKDYLYPGCGFGGATLDENVARVARELKLATDDLGLLEIVSKINQRQKDLLFRKIWQFFKADIVGKKIAIWGAAFKPGTASIDHAPAVTLIDSLLAQQAEVAVYDPLAATSLTQRYANKILVGNNAYQVLESADVLAICTEWKEFWSPDFKQIEKALNYKAIFDGRNLYNLQHLKEFDLQYFGIGRSNQNH